MCVVFRINRTLLGELRELLKSMLSADLQPLCQEFLMDAKTVQLPCVSRVILRHRATFWRENVRQEGSRAVAAHCRVCLTGATSVPEVSAEAGDVRSQTAKEI